MKERGGIKMSSDKKVMDRWKEVLRNKGKMRKWEQEQNGIRKTWTMLKLEVYWRRMEKSKNKKIDNK